MRHRWSLAARDRGWSVIADLMSVGNNASGLEKAHIPRNRGEPGKITRSHVTFAAESTKLWLWGRATLDDKESAEQRVALPGGGGERGEIPPLSDLGGTFSIRTIKH